MRIGKSWVLVAALLLCGTLVADIVRDFSPPLACDGSKAVELGKDCKLAPPLKRPAPYAVFFYKSGEFFFGIRQQKLYFYASNAGNGTWNQDVAKAGVMSDAVLSEEDRELHLYVLTISRYIEKAQGIDRTEVKIYIDGGLVGARTLDRFDWKDAGRPLVACAVEPHSRTFNPKIGRAHV